MNQAAEARVAARLLDEAALAAEHDNDMLADILKAEASALQNGSVEALTAQAHHHAPEVEEPFALEGDVLATLRVTRSLAEKQKTVLAFARAMADDIIESAWLREGYAIPA